MAAGVTTTSSLADSLPVIKAAARIVREQEGRMPQLVDRQRLAEGTGLTWEEVALSRLNDAQPISEGEEFNAPQQLVDQLLQATPQEVGFEIIMTDRVRRRISPNVFAQTGSLAGSSMARTKGKDGITQLDQFSTSFGGAGTTFAEGYIEAAVVTIEGNSTEHGVAPFFSVHHPFQRRDLAAELAPIGNISIYGGLTEDLIKNGVVEMTMGGAGIGVDAVVGADGSGDFKGGTFAKMAIVLVEGHDLETETERLVGRRADAIFMFDEYIYAERFDSGGVEQYFDATAPTS